MTSDEEIMNTELRLMKSELVAVEIANGNHYGVVLTNAKTCGWDTKSVKTSATYIVFDLNRDDGVVDWAESLLDLRVFPDVTILEAGEMKRWLEHNTLIPPKPDDSKIYVKILNSAHCKMIQNKAFECGFTWQFAKHNLKHVDCPCLVFYAKGKRIKGYVHKVTEVHPPVSNTEDTFQWLEAHDYEQQTWNGFPVIIDKNMNDCSIVMESKTVSFDLQELDKTLRFLFEHKAVNNKLYDLYAIVVEDE